MYNLYTYEKQERDKELKEQEELKLQQYKQKKQSKKIFNLLIFYINRNSKKINNRLPKSSPTFFIQHDNRPL